MSAMVTSSPTEYRPPDSFAKVSYATVKTCS
jgi:hypothetical protein